MSRNVNVRIGSAGSCCSCSTSPPCSDCDKEPPPPPPEPCDCSRCGYFNVLSACKEEANSLYDGCGKCDNLGPCQSICPGIGTHGCYAPVSKDCFDLGCVPCSKEYEPSDPCFKLDATAPGCICGKTLSCCTYTEKICTDFNFNYYSDTAQATLFCGGLNCFKSVKVGCPTLSCYECKTCEDFGLSATKPGSCPPKTYLSTETPCGTKLTCYACVPANCNCNTVGLANSCNELNPSDCEVCEGDIGYLTSPGCEDVYCYYLRQKTCSELSSGSVTCKNCDSPTKDDNCYYMLKTLNCRCDFNGGNTTIECCQETPRDCQSIGLYKKEPYIWGSTSSAPKDACPCDYSWEPIASGCKETTGCYTCQKMNCWKVVGISGAPVGSPCCVTSQSLSFNPACSKGAAETVAIQNVSGSFTVSCNPPPGCKTVWPDPNCGSDPLGGCCCAEYCAGKAPDLSWPIGPADTVVLTSCTKARATFSFEDCNISPADYKVFVDLEMCYC